VVESSAETSLGAGAGPAGGRSESCGTMGGRTAHCGFQSGAASPLSPSWFNVTLFSGQIHPESFASLAWDPGWANGMLVYFGGCSLSGACPENYTWIYGGLFWENVTASGPSPPALAASGMDWDPSLNGIVLAGGFGTNGFANGGTWLFSGGNWENITSSVGGLSESPPTAYGAMAWDPAISALVLIGGCNDVFCDSVYSNQWTLGGTGTWANFSTYDDVYGESVAYDAVDRELIAVGGVNRLGAQLNSTWAFSEGAWSNLTDSSVGCFLRCNLYPPGRAFASATWDLLSSSVLLFGGINESSGSMFNDSWSFSGNSWFPFALASGVAPPPEFGGAMPVNSSGFAPVLVGGRGAGAGDMFAMETPPVPKISATPSPADIGADVSVTISVAAGTGSGPWSEVATTYGNSQANTTSIFGITGSLAWGFTNTSLTYPGPDTFEMETVVVDFFYVSATAFYNLSIVPGPLAKLSTAPALGETGFPVSFAANVTSGVPPYSYSWTFGDGGYSTASSPSHDYTLPGTYTANLTVTDRGGGYVEVGTHVQVMSGVVARATANVTATDAGLPIGFAGSAVGGTGPYGPYVWNFGGGSTVQGATAVHTFSIAGSFVVGLNVTDNFGFEATADLPVLVNPDLALGPLGSGPSNPVPGQAIGLTVVPSGGTAPLTYNWTFGDGSTGTGASPSHVYFSVGTYSVQLVVTDAMGEKATERGVVTVSNASANVEFAWTSGPGLFLLLGGGVAILLLAGVMVVLRRRARSRRAGATLPTGVVEEVPPANPPPGQ
jgi:PKD repeat protein